MTEVDIILYSYLKVLHLSSIFVDLKASIENLTYLINYFNNMDQTMANILKEKLDIN